MKYSYFIAIFFVISLSTLNLFGQIKHLSDVRTLMRDGIELSSDIYLPEKEGKYPSILVRTPYLKTEEAMNHPEFGKFFVSHDYVFIIQDVRGRGESEGEFNFFFQEGKDGYDMIEWIAKQDWCNGRVGTMGVSYMGEVQWLAASERPPHLVCMAPTAPGGGYFDDIPYMGGAWMMQWALGWLNFVTSSKDKPMITNVDWNKVYSHRPLITADSVMGRKMPLYRNFLKHCTIDEYWKPLLLTPEDYRNIDIPVLHVTGWFDPMQVGFNVHWKGMNKYSPAREKQYALIGPWDHMQTYLGGQTKMGEMEFTDDSVIDMKALHLAFFNRYLKGTTKKLDFPKVKVYMTGKNVWRKFNEYPPAHVNNTSLYFHSGGKANTLDGDGKLGWKKPGKEVVDKFTYDPKNPVPAEYRNAVDSRDIAKREDVLVYTSDEFQTSVEVVGNIVVNVYASSDALDTDFTARILEVFPDGMALTVGLYAFGAIKRARYRNGYAKEELLTPNKPELFKIKLAGIGHVFFKGHRIRIEISSSIYPFFNPNQNTGNPVATDTDWKIAHQTICHDKTKPSHVLLPIIK